MDEKLLAMLILVQKENEDQNHIFQDTLWESCEINQLAILYHFEHTNHCSHLNSLQILFASVKLASVISSIAMGL